MRKALWSMALLGYVTFLVGCAETKKVEPAAAPSAPAADHGHSHAPGEAHDHDHEEKAPAAVPAPEPAVTDPLAPAAESEAPPAPDKAPE